MTDLDWVPSDCTLPTEERPLRIAQWDELLAGHLTALNRPAPTLLRLSLSEAAALEERVWELADRESGCCGFFTFVVTEADGAVLLDIAVDPGHEAVLQALSARAADLAGLGDRP
ncbi:hypothetical protein AB0I00_32915 [Streptomyces sp. NPDC050803]|uniref:hypothetical protein n=1 Tax=unclassified Streptomyces TaxID=2593676 RepID=UPI00343A17E8